MSEEKYGQMAPQLADGSLLLQDVCLTPDQTNALKSDAEVLTADELSEKRDRRNLNIVNRTFLAVLSVNLLTIVLTLMNVLAFPMGLTNFISIGSILVMQALRIRTNNRALERLTRMKSVLSGDGAKVPLEMAKRFLGDPDFQLAMYTSLVTTKTAPVTPSGDYNLVLNTESETKYRVQTVLKQKTADQ